MMYGLTCAFCLQCLRRSSHLNNKLVKVLPVSYRLSGKQYSSAPLPLPDDNGSTTYPEHIVDIVSSIEKLNLLEVSKLNQLLKERLNIQDFPMMPMAGMAAPAAPVEEETAPVDEQTEFAVKLLKFDDSKKVKLIKEIKVVLTDMNLVQAKKFVEGAPQTVKEKLSKEDAEKLKTQLEAVGGVVEIE